MSAMREYNSYRLAGGNIKLCIMESSFKLDEVNIYTEGSENTREKGRGGGKRVITVVHGTFIYLSISLITVFSQTNLII